MVCSKTRKKKIPCTSRTFGQVRCLFNKQSISRLYFWVIGFNGVDTSRQGLLGEAIQNSEQTLQHGSDRVRPGPGRQPRKIQCKRPT